MNTLFLSPTDRLEETVRELQTISGYSASERLQMQHAEIESCQTMSISQQMQSIQNRWTHHLREAQHMIDQGRRRAIEALEHYQIIQRLKLVYSNSANTAHVIRRDKDATASTGKKTTAKKSAKSSGGGSDGGDSGGDGDGPHRTAKLSKNSRAKPRNAPLQHPPSSSPVEIANSPASSPHSSPPYGQGLLLSIFIIKWIVILLLTFKGEHKMAGAVLAFISEKKLMGCVIKRPK